MKASYLEKSGSSGPSAEAMPTRSKPSERALSRSAVSRLATARTLPRVRSRSEAWYAAGAMSWDSAPLLSKRRSGAPSMAYRVFRPEKPARVAVLMSTGYFENMARYREVIQRWNQRGILAAIYDLRGHG